MEARQGLSSIFDRYVLRSRREHSSVTGGDKDVHVSSMCVKIEKISEARGFLSATLVESPFNPLFFLGQNKWRCFKGNKSS
jgi:hypothetical protein